MANGATNGATKADLADAIDQAVDILSAAYIPEADRETLAGAVGDRVSCADWRRW
jgi:hypothetical protein